MIETKPTRVGRPSSVATHPERITIEAQLASGRALRRIASQFSLSTTALHRHKADGMTEATVPSAQDICAICKLPHERRDAVSRALAGTAAPDPAKIAARFGVAEFAVQMHWGHVGAGSMDPQPQPALAPAPAAAPLPELLTLDQAREFARDPRAAFKAEQAAKASYQAFCRDWAGPPRVKDSAFRDWRAALAHDADQAMRLIATARFVRRIAELGASDGRVAAYVAALPAPMVPKILDVAPWIADLARRGIVLRLIDGHAISAQPAGLLAAVDRRHLAEHRQAIVRYLEAPAEVF